MCETVTLCHLNIKCEFFLDILSLLFRDFFKSREKRVITFSYVEKIISLQHNKPNNF